MLGAGYALSKGIHIRADFLYRNFSVKMQGTVDAALYLFFLFSWHAGISLDRNGFCWCIVVPNGKSYGHRMDAIYRPDQVRIAHRRIFFC